MFHQNGAGRKNLGKKKKPNHFKNQGNPRRGGRKWATLKTRGGRQAGWKLGNSKSKAIGDCPKKEKKPVPRSQRPQVGVKGRKPHKGKNHAKGVSRRVPACDTPKRRRVNKAAEEKKKRYPGKKRIVPRKPDRKTLGPRKLEKKLYKNRRETVKTERIKYGQEETRFLEIEIKKKKAQGQKRQREKNKNLREKQKMGGRTLGVKGF